MSESEVAKSKGYEFDWKPVRAWLCAIGVILFWMSGSGANRMATAIMPSILKLGLSVNYGATLHSMFVFVNALAAFPIGIWVTKRGIRGPGWTCLSSLILGTILFASTQNPILLLVARAIQGIGMTMAPIMGVMMVCQWFPKSKRTLPLGCLAGGPGLASIIMLQGSNFAKPIWGWQGVCYVELALCCVALIFWIFFVKPGPGEQKYSPEKAAKAAAAGQKAKISDVLKMKEIWIISFIFLLCSLSSNAFNPFSNVVFMDNLGVKENVAGNLSSGWQFTTIIAPIFVGWLSGKIGKLRTYIFPFMQLLYLSGLGMSFYLHSIQLVLIFVIGFGFMSTASAYCNELLSVFCPSPAVLATASTIYSFLGMYTGSFLGGYVASFAKSFSGVWAPVTAFIITFAVVCCILMSYMGFKMRKKINAGEIK